VPVSWKPPLHFFYGVMMAVREAGQREHIEYIAAIDRPTLARSVRSIIEAGMEDPQMLYMALLPVDLPTNRAEVFNMHTSPIPNTGIDARVWWGHTEATYYGSLEDICQLVEQLLHDRDDPYMQHASHLFGTMHAGTADG